MTKATENTAEASATTEVEVTDLNQFVRLLAQWHQRKVKTLEHFLQLPEGQVVQLDDQPEFAITGDVHKGFMLGMNLALMEFGTLPFTFEVEDAVQEPAATATTPE